MVKDKVAGGLYNNASEVVREALRLMELRDRNEMFLTETAKGFSQLRQGKTVVLDIKRTKRTAKADAKSRRAVNPLVTP